MRSNTTEVALSLPGLAGGVEELTQHFDRNHLPLSGRDLVLRTLTSPPVRRVGGGGGNVVVRYASRKMRRVIQAESRNIELAFVERCEHDPAVIFFLCQPTVLSVRITDRKRRDRSVETVPDYLVLHAEDGFYFVECKPLSALEKFAARRSGRFERDGSGWRSPAGERAAAEYGLGFRVFTSDAKDLLWMRNVRYFSDFVGADCPDPDKAQAVADRLAAAGSIRTHEVLVDTGADPEIVWWLIANGRAAADLQRERCFELDTSWVHASEELMLAARHRPSSVARHAFRPELSALRVESRSQLLWDGKPWTVLNVAPDCVTLREDSTGTLAPIPAVDLERLFVQGHIRAKHTSGLEEIDRRAEDLVLAASPKALAAANRAVLLLDQADETGRVPKGTSARSLRRYRARRQDGELRYGSGYLGLVRRRGRRPGTPDLDRDQRTILATIVEKYSTDPKAGRVTRAFDRLAAVCEERGIRRPSRETVRRAIKAHRRAKLARAREGARAAYQLEGPLRAGADRLPATPDRAFEVAHIDHTKLDVELVSHTTGAALGRPWISLMIEARSRLPLGVSLSFDAPSKVALGEVLFDAISRFHRVPDNLSVDQGPEFNSVNFEAALAHLQVHKVERPVAKPRFGSIIERMFGTTNTQLVHELLGNTKLLRRPRSLSATHHPSRHAVWTLPLFYEVLEKWLFDVYPGLLHGSLGASPREVFDHDRFRSGHRAARYVRADAALRILLAVTPDGGLRKVDSVRGILVAHLRYWHEDFGRGDVGGSTVEVRVEPLDCGIAYAWVRGRWTVCSLVDGAADLVGRSWKQIALVIKALRQQHSEGARGRDINAATIGRFIREADEKGELARQILRDAATHAVASPSSLPPGSGPLGLRLVKTDSASPDSAAVAPAPASATTPASPGVVDDLDGILDEVAPCDVQS